MKLLRNVRTGSNQAVDRISTSAIEMLADDRHTRNYIRSILKQRFLPPLRISDFDDILQEGLLRVWLNRHKFDRSKGTLCQWYYGVCIRVAREYSRCSWLQQRQREAHAGAAATRSFVTRSQERVQSFATANVRQRVHRAVADLTDRMRAVIEADLAHEEGKIPAERLAASLGISASTVRTYRQRGYHLLRQLLSLNVD